MRRLRVLRCPRTVPLLQVLGRMPPPKHCQTFLGRTPPFFPPPELGYLTGWFVLYNGQDPLQFSLIFYTTLTIFSGCYSSHNGYALAGTQCVNIRQNLGTLVLPNVSGFQGPFEYLYRGCWTIGVYPESHIAVLKIYPRPTQIQPPHMSQNRDFAAPLFLSKQG